MSKVAASVLLPCFLIANLSTTTLDQLKKGWILPVMSCFHIALGALMGQVGCLLLGKSATVAG